MKLAAVYNVFDGEELLEGSIRQIRKQVNVVICVVQRISNYGETYEGGLEKCRELKNKNLVDVVVEYSPSNLGAQKNETAKRQIGVDEAKLHGCTHFLLMDCDEYYFEEEFIIGKKIAEVARATYVPLCTYFGSPKYMITPNENYFVPFICELNAYTKVGNYLFGGIYCDPTRKVASRPIGVNVRMHHYSWVRKSIARKIDNSTAKSNIKVFRNDLIVACANPYEGMKVPFYDNKKLKKVQDHFDIGRII